MLFDESFSSNHLPKRNNNGYGGISNAIAAEGWHVSLGRWIAKPVERSANYLDIASTKAPTLWEAAMVQKTEMSVGLTELMKNFFAAKRFSASTEEVYLSTLNRFIAHVGCHTDLREISEIELASFLKGYEQYAIATYNSNLSALKSFFAWASAESVVRVNPCDGLRRRRRAC